MEYQRNFKDLVSKHLGRKVRNKYKEILFNILIVDNNIKPGYLVDCGSLNAKSLVELIQDMYSLKMIQNPLNILIIDLDFLIVNPSYTLKQLEDKNNIPKCVDVSATLEKPKLLDDKILLSAREIIRQSNMPECLISSVELSTHDFNITSMFGVLLGYPVVYWFDTENNRSENCLSMQPLRVIEVRGNFHKNEQISNSDSYYHQIYSFSIPEGILDELDFNAVKWFENLKQFVKWKTLFDDIELIEKTVTLPFVCM